MFDYKYIVDFNARTKINNLEYWEHLSLEHATEGIPKTFSQDLYV